MNKKQLVAKLAGSLNQSKADAERTFDTITNTKKKLDFKGIL